MNTTRRLLLFLDGTWNEDAAYDQDTNVVRLRNLVARNISPLNYVPRTIADVNKYDKSLSEIGVCPYKGCDYFTFYERGVGTGPGLDRISGGALGWGVETNVRRAYKFLSQFYLPGSEIFIFGFSRGSYTARSLVGFLGSAGLLTAKNCTFEVEQQAWDYYRTFPGDRLPGTKKQLERYTHPLRELRVACLGLFDTVGALGIPFPFFWRFNRLRYEFHDVLLSPIVKLNLHALAIDERRIQFSASIWRQNKFRVSNSVTEQTWFPGVHADVGGGYFTASERSHGPRRVDDVTLDWISKRLLHHYPDFPILEGGLGLLSGPTDEDDEVLQHNSRIGKYRLLPSSIRAIGNRPPPVFPHERVSSYDRGEGVVGESIHISALERLGTSVTMRPPGKQRLYLPRNLILILPDLWDRYCNDPLGDWSLESVSVTTWDGEVVNYGVSSDETALKQVQKAIIDALKRLEELGYNVLSQTWNLQAASKYLARSKAAPKIPMRG
jgi:hypothetical protein